MALSACGARKKVAIPGEASREAEECDLWYEPVRRHIFRAAHWKCLKRQSRLGLLVERDTAEDWVSTDPETGYAYAYSMPADCMVARYLSTYQRFTTGTYFSTGVRALFTDVEDAILTYTSDVTNVGLWDSDLYLAVAYGLSAHISMPLTGKGSRTNSLIGFANDIITKARVTNANEEVFRPESLPEWLQARGYAGGASVDQFIAPYGPMLTLMGAPLA